MDAGGRAALSGPPIADGGAGAARAHFTLQVLTPMIE